MFLFYQIYIKIPKYQESTRVNINLTLENECGAHIIGFKILYFCIN